MTKLLSRLLEAEEPQFRQTLAKLEAASGHACHDIRLSESIMRSYREKITALGLDPDDTTGEELYHALQEKLRQDDTRLVKRLRQVGALNVSAAGELSEGIAYSVSQIASGSKVFVIKGSVVKRWLTKNPPRRTMRALGYRSVASLLKHEQPGLLMAVALTLEPKTWEKRYNLALKGLSSRDFEEHSVSVYAPLSEKWHQVCLEIVSETKQTVLVNKELGSMVIMPLPSRKPVAGLTTATLAIAANGLNSIYAMSSYLRLSQVAGDFGYRVERAATDEPDLGFVDLINSPLSWETVQRFFHRMAGKIDGALEEHIRTEEIIGWQPIETLIHRVAPEMGFWRDCGHLGMLDGIKPVSFNIFDNALSLVNHRRYYQHYYHHVQRALWQELILRYIKPELLHEVVSRELSPKLEAELVSV